MAAGVAWMRRSDIANTGPARISVGTATTIPYSSVVPMSAWIAATSATGDGCGGKKPCAIESPANSGIASATAGRPLPATSEKISGTKSTKPTL